MKKSLIDLIFPIKNPKLPAVIYHDGNCSVTFNYGDLSEAVHQVSAALRPLCFENTVVAVSIQESHYLVPILFLGILQSKAAFTYLDQECPILRQKEVLKTSRASIIIADSEELMFGWTLVTKLALLTSNHKLYILQENSSKDQKYSGWNIAYVIHTSGSTGTPKAVHVPHSCILPNILDLRERFDMQQGDIILSASPFTFDPSIVDIFLALSTGARLVIVKPSIKSMTSKLAEIIRTEGVTFIQATPSFFLQFGPRLSKNYLLYPSSPLRIVVLGGEPFPSFKMLEEFRSSANSTVFYNIYGITEVSCWATLRRIESNENPVDLGVPLSETSIRVINDKEEEIHHGEGYLMLGGNRICLLDEETPEALHNPVFRSTGDRVELVDGKLFYRGRTDETVKRMGKRANLHSVELLALSSGLVRQCCALIDSHQLLILVCTELADVEKLKQHFQVTAPVIERPDEIRIVESLPVSKHGKVDRKKLLEFVQALPKTLSSWETILTDEWMSATGKNSTDESNFISSGGNSLSALRLISRIEEQVARPLPLLIDILLNRDWNQVVDYIRKETLGDPVDSIQPVNIFQRNQKSATSPEFKLFELKPNWKFNLKKCIDASPLVIQRKDGATVFIGSHSHRFCAVSLDSGQEVWTRELPERIESSACCDPAGLHVFVGCYDGHLYCLDAVDGRICWQFLTGDAIKSSPLCTGSSVIFGSHDRTLYALSTGSGELIWKRTISSGSLFASPAWDGNDRLLAASLDGTCSALDVTCGRVLWTVKLAAPIFSSPVWSSEKCLLCSVDGFISCCSAGEITWRFQAAGPIFSTPSITDGRIVFGSHDHSLYCLDQDTGSLLWTVPFSSPVYSSPFTTSFVIICCDTSGRLKVLESTSGRLLSETKLSGQVFSSPVLVDRFVVVGCRDDNLYCFHNHLWPPSQSHDLFQ